MTEEWGPWIDHDGMGCPCVGQYVQAEYKYYQPEWSMGFTAMGGQSWFWHTGYNSVIRYRIRKPRAMKLLQSIVENPPKQLIKEDA